MAKAAQAEGAINYIDRVYCELASNASQAMQSGHRSAVHKARVATRRMAAALDLLDDLIPRSDHKEIGRSLKRIRRSVQDLRDLDVMQDHLKEMPRTDSDRDRTTRRDLIQQLGRERRERFAEVATRAKIDRWLDSIAAWGEIRLSLGENREQIRRSLYESARRQFAEFSHQADLLSAAVNSAASHNVHPHKLRIAGKALRYTLEMAEAERLLPDDTATRIYKQLQNALGEWHDFYALALRLVEMCGSAMQSPGYRQDGDAMLAIASRAVCESRERLFVFARIWTEKRGQLQSHLGRPAGTLKETK